MSSNISNIKEELNNLVNEGKLLYKLLYDKNYDDGLFIPSYQNWYTKTLNIVKIFLPERLDEFILLHKNDKRKEIDYLTYTISDFLLGIVVKRAGDPVFNNKESAGRKFFQQICIVESTLSKLDSIICNIKSILEADLFDSELDAAQELIKNKYYRAAGALAGVVLEKHLKTVSFNHCISLLKKSPTIADYNDALKNADIIDVPNWRNIQRLGDLRNLCSHSKDRDPNPDEVQELINGVKKIIKTLF